ncbi:hypothetical protein CIJ93_22730, partial [Escherichia coli]
NLNGLATGAMKVNYNHERTLNSSILALNQLIGSIASSSKKNIMK